MIEKDWIEDWKKELGKKGFDCSKLHGEWMSTKNLDLALDMSKCHTDYLEHQQPVLFVISARNYEGFHGIKLNDKRFTPFPQERAYFISDALTCYILRIEEFTIQNEYIPKYDRKKIMVIYIQSSY